MAAAAVAAAEAEAKAEAEAAAVRRRHERAHRGRSGGTTDEFVDQEALAAAVAWEVAKAQKPVLDELKKIRVIVEDIKKMESARPISGGGGDTSGAVYSHHPELSP